MQYANYQPYPYYQSYAKSAGNQKSARFKDFAKKIKRIGLLYSYLFFINEYHCSRYNIFINRVYDAEYGYF